MEVKDLIKALSNYPPNKEVMVYKQGIIPDKIARVIYNPGIDIVFIEGEDE